MQDKPFQLKRTEEPCAICGTNLIGMTVVVGEEVEAVWCDSKDCTNWL